MEIKLKAIIVRLMMIVGMAVSIICCESVADAKTQTVSSGIIERGIEFADFTLEQEMTFTTNENKVYFKFTTPNRSIASFFRVTYTNLSDDRGRVHFYEDKDFVKSAGILRADKKSVNDYEFCFEPNRTYYGVIAGDSSGVVADLMPGKGDHKVIINEIYDDLPNSVGKSIPITIDSMYSYHIWNMDDDDWFCFTTGNYYENTKYGFYLASGNYIIDYTIYDNIDCVEKIDYGEVWSGRSIFPVYTLEPNHTYYVYLRSVEETNYNFMIADYASIKNVKPVIKSVKGKKKREIIKWNKVNVGGNDVTGYYVYRSTKKNGKYKYVGYTATNSYTDNRVKKKKKYFYKIIAYRSFSDGTVYKSRASNVKGAKTK